MEYALLIYETQKDFGDRDRDLPESAAYWGAWQLYSEEMHAADIGPKGPATGMLGRALQPPETATTVRVRDGQRLVQDGPFADAKEQLGGFIIIDVPTLD